MPNFPVRCESLFYDPQVLSSTVVDLGAISEITIYTIPDNCSGIVILGLTLRDPSSAYGNYWLAVGGTAVTDTFNYIPPSNTYAVWGVRNASNVYGAPGALVTFNPNSGSGNATVDLLGYLTP